MSVVDGGGNSLSLGCVPGSVTQGVSMGVFEVLVWNVILCVAQSIDRFCWSNHKYPRTAEVKCASGVRRNWIGCVVPLGNLAFRMVDCTMSLWEADEPSDKESQSGCLRLESRNPSEIVKQESINESEVPELIRVCIFLGFLKLKVDK